jgi:uncharacterized membrane protein HdeD (DUF308 family)
METENRALQIYPWWLLLLQGISAVILGFLLITQPASTAEIIVTFIGAYWLVSGIFYIVLIFTAAGRSNWGWTLLNGIIGIIAGIFVLRHPLLSTVLLPTTLVIVLGVFGILIGFSDLVRGFKGHGFGAYVMGVLNILIGIWLLFDPLAFAVSLPLVLGIFGLVGGVILVFHSFQVRKS